MLIRAKTTRRIWITIILMVTATLVLSGQEIDERSGAKVGLFLDAGFLGINIWSTGVGVGFFDNSVRLQLNAGIAPVGRFGGRTLSSKVLADVYVIEYGRAIGPYFDHLSSALAVGASLTYFSMTGDTVYAIGDGPILTAAVVHLDVARIRLADWVLFNLLSIYTEGLLVFIPSEVEGGVVLKVSFGLRSDIF